jgi:DNA-binding NarL/FixJ family response regulator
MSIETAGDSPEIIEVRSSGPAKPVRVIVADSEPIFRVGMRKIFALEDDIRVVAQAETVNQTISAVKKFAADVVLFEARLSDSPFDTVTEIAKSCANIKIVLIVSETREEDTIEYLRRGVRGIVTRIIAPDMLIKCLRKVFDGETWLDNRGRELGDRGLPLPGAATYQPSRPGQAEPQGTLDHLGCDAGPAQ